jgi:hypothetical protein
VPVVPRWLIHLQSGRVQRCSWSRCILDFHARLRHRRAHPPLRQSERGKDESPGAMFEESSALFGGGRRESAAPQRRRRRAGSTPSPWRPLSSSGYSARHSSSRPNAANCRRRGGATGAQYCAAAAHQCGGGITPQASGGGVGNQAVQRRWVSLDRPSQPHSGAKLATDTR